MRSSRARLKTIKDAVHTHELNSQSVKEKIELQKGFILQLEEKKDKDIELKKKQLRVILDQQDSCREKISDANTMISEINEKIVALNNPEKRKNDLVDLARKLNVRLPKSQVTNVFMKTARIVLPVSNPLVRTLNLSKLQHSTERSERSKQRLMTSINALLKLFHR